MALFPFGFQAGGGGTSVTALNYLGTWDASTNTPTITSGVGTAGDYYIVNVAGNTNIDGISDWAVGDWIIFSSTGVWQKIDNSDLEGYNLIEDEGTPLPKESILDFQGTGVSAIPGFGKTIVQIPGTFVPEVRYVAYWGSDVSGDGSYTKPFQTLAFALIGISANTVIYVFGGLYTEPTVNIPDSVVISAFGEANVEFSNGFSYIATATNTEIYIHQININNFTVDASLSINGTIQIKQCSYNLLRSDSNLSVLFNSTESTQIGGIVGGNNIFTESLVIGTVSASPGSLLIFENSRFILRVEANGNCVVQMSNCSLFVATEFINGTIVAGNTPTWKVDTTTEFLGGYTGSIDKILLANVYTTVEDEGVVLPQQRTIDFQGLGVTASDDPLNNKTIVSIPGGGLTYWTEALNNSAPNVATNVSSLTPNVPTADGDAVILPKGDGAFLLNTPELVNNAYGVGGLKRGVSAVDLQRRRFSNTEIASGNYSVLLGGIRNTVSGYGAIGGGGYQNRASAQYSTSIGGSGNTASGYGSITIGGINNVANANFSFTSGYFNTASNPFNSVSGGLFNTASGYRASSIVGGRSNTTSSAYGFIGGGCGNTASNTYGTVSGGRNNLNCSSYGTISGGANGYAASGYATIGGGYYSEASGSYSTVGGGQSNRASNSNSVVSGGALNCSTGASSTVSGGYNNRATASFSTLAGGTGNSSSAYASTVSGGRLNCAIAGYGTVTGGFCNTASNTYTFIGGGCGNTVSQPYGTIGGGSGNSTGQAWATIGGGKGNNTNFACISFIGGGQSNTVSSYAGMVAGGIGNNSVGQYATIGGGASHTSSGVASIVGGGGGNISSGDYSGVFSGVGNSATSQKSFVGGGNGNTASNTYAIVIGGYINQASGYTSTASGYGSVASGSFSVASGKYASTQGITGRVSHSSGSFSAVRGEAQKSTFVLRASTTSSTPSNLTADGGAIGTSNQVILADQSSYRFKGTIVGKRPGSTDTASWDIDGFIVRGTGVATTSLIINNVNVVDNTPGWNTPTLSADTTNGGLTVTANGLGVPFIVLHWVAVIETTEVIYA